MILFLEPFTECLLWYYRYTLASTSAQHAIEYFLDKHILMSTHLNLAPHVMSVPMRCHPLVKVRPQLSLLAWESSMGNSADEELLRFQCLPSATSHIVKHVLWI